LAQLRDIWAAQSTNTEAGAVRIEVSSWLSRTTLDVIGLAGSYKFVQSIPAPDLTWSINLGFNYKFNALNSDTQQNELNSAFRAIFKASTKITFIPILRALFPPLRFLVRFALSHISIALYSSQPTDRDAGIKQSQRTMSLIGNQLLRESKAANEYSTEKNSWKARDLLSLLVRANMATDLPEHQRMSDKDVLDRELWFCT
jgi:hypothetical protein